MNLNRAKSCDNCCFQSWRLESKSKIILSSPYEYYECLKHNEDIGNTESENFRIWALVCDDHEFKNLLKKGDKRMESQYPISD